MPFDPTHPDPEQLAALQAGELAGADGAQVAAHVAGCAECARVLAVAERGRSALTGLPQVEPPAGLHQRLAAALERELEVGDGIRAHQGLAGGNGQQERRLAAAAADADALGEAAPVTEPDVVDPVADADGPRGAAPVTEPDGHGEVAEPVPLAGRRRRRSRPRDRRVAALLSAAAAMILLVAGLVPLLRHTGGQATTSAEGGGSAAPSAAAGGAPGPLPVFSAPDGYSGSALESALAGDPQARAAYQRAAGAQAESGSPRAVGPQLSGGGAEAKSTTSAGPAGDSATSGGASRPRPVAPGPAGLQQGVCVANARNQAGDQGLRPAFFVDTVYQGRPATVLVTVRPAARGQADLWAFPRGNCSSPPFAHELVKITPP
ncbi:MAG TPA: hypothetical protein VGC06_27645 [Actinomycetes bacterium]